MDKISSNLLFTLRCSKRQQNIWYGLDETCVKSISCVVIIMLSSAFNSVFSFLITATHTSVELKSLMFLQSAKYANKDNINVQWRREMGGKTSRQMWILNFCTELLDHWFCVLDINHTLNWTSTCFMLFFFRFFYTKRCFDSPWWECPWPWLSTVTKNWIWQISILMRWKKRKKVRFCTLPEKKIEIINVKIIWKYAFVLNFCYLFVDGIVVSYWIVKISKEEEL